MYYFSGQAFLPLCVSFLLILFVELSPSVHSAPPKLLLAEVYEEGIELKHYWVSEKLDGVRAYWEGMMGALVVELADGRHFKIGTGFSDAERAAPPPVGAVITFKFYGLTVTGLPRFASFIRIRDDEPGTE